MSPIAPDETGRSKEVPDEPPPILAGRDGSWKRIYGAVLVYIAVVITLLYVVTLGTRY